MCTPHPSYRSHLLFTEALPRPCCNEGAFVSPIMERIYRRRPTFQENPNIPYCSVLESCHYVRLRCQEYMQKKAVFCCFYKELRPPKLFWDISFSHVEWLCISFLFLPKLGGKRDSSSWRNPVETVCSWSRLCWKAFHFVSMKMRRLGKLRKLFTRIIRLQPQSRRLPWSQEPGTPFTSLRITQQLCHLLGGTGKGSQGNGRD